MKIDEIKKLCDRMFKAGENFNAALYRNDRAARGCAVEEYNAAEAELIKLLDVPNDSVMLPGGEVVKVEGVYSTDPEREGCWSDSPEEAIDDAPLGQLVRVYCSTTLPSRVYKVAEDERGSTVAATPTPEELAAFVEDERVAEEARRRHFDELNRKNAKAVRAVPFADPSAPRSGGTGA